MRTAPLFAAITAALLLAPSAHAQLSGPTGSLERFSPAQPGDPMFGVASPSIGGHLVPRFAVAFDYAHHPLSIQDGSQRLSIVSRQGFLHVGASFALFDRLQVSADMPFALLQGGDSPTVAGTTFTSPSSPQVGDFRLGARVRIVGGDWDAFQLGVGANAFFPSAPKGSYAGDGAIRGEYDTVQEALRRGEDDIGRDNFALVMKGTQTSLMVMVVLGLITLVLGVTVGALSGYYRGRTDTILMRFTDLVITLPVIVTASLPPSPLIVSAPLNETLSGR